MTDKCVHRFSDGSQVVSFRLPCSSDTRGWVGFRRGVQASQNHAPATSKVLLNTETFGASDQTYGKPWKIGEINKCRVFCFVLFRFCPFTRSNDVNRYKTCKQTSKRWSVYPRSTFDVDFTEDFVNFRWLALMSDTEIICEREKRWLFVICWGERQKLTWIMQIIYGFQHMKGQMGILVWYYFVNIVCLYQCFNVLWDIKNVNTQSCILRLPG